jgi:hypothetical protein
MQMASVLVIDSARHSRSGIGVQAGDNHLLAAVGEGLRDLHQPRSEEIRLVDADDLGARIGEKQNLADVIHDFGLHSHVGVADDFILGIASIEGGFEYLHAAAGDHRTPEPPDQFFALAGEHGPADHLNPSDVPHDYIHTGQNIAGWCVPACPAAELPLAWTASRIPDGCGAGMAHPWGSTGCPLRESIPSKDFTLKWRVVQIARDFHRLVVLADGLDETKL